MDAACTVAHVVEEPAMAETSTATDLTYADAVLEILLHISDSKNIARGKPT